MRGFIFAIAAGVMFAQSLAAQTTTAPPAAPAPAEPTSTQHIFPGDAIPAIPHATWIESGVIRVAVGAPAVAKAPATATRYSVKTIVHPTGTIHEMMFTKTGGGVFHPVGTITQLYVLKGSAEVGVGSQRVQIKQGDAISRPSGILRSQATPEDTTIIAWSVGSSVKNPKPMVIRGEDVTAETTAEWMEGDKVVRTADTNAKAPPDAKKLISKRYEFDGNSIRVARMLKGGSRAPALMTADSLIYITHGRLRFHQYGNGIDEVREVTSGDFIREQAGMTHIWDQLEDGGFVTTTGIAP
ncbi:MAG: hypothetical protein EXR11_13285 [Rhodospirillaceae bacterium]|nr:hypothetical protein [Rhodospirillaceae bacterium]